MTSDIQARFRRARMRSGHQPNCHALAWQALNAYFQQGVSLRRAFNMACRIADGHAPEDVSAEEQMRALERKYGLDD